MKTRSKTLLLGAASALALTIPGTIYDTARAQQIVLPEISVTARKREESLLDVPLSVTVLTADDIEIKGVTQFKDIIDFTPGFFFAEHSVGRGDRSNRLLVVRGMRINTENDHQQAATVFVDGAPMLGNVISGLEDAARVEVIKGPQSAYFGRSTFAGAINFVTKTPSDEFQGKITAEGGRFGTTDVGVQIEGPLMEDVASYRISTSWYETNGHYQLGNDPEQRLGQRETFDISGMLYITPSDRFSAKLRLHYWHDNDGPSAAFGYGRGNGEEYFNCNPPGSTLPPHPDGGPNNWICGEAPFPTAQQINGNFDLVGDKIDLLNGIPSDGFSIDTAFEDPFLQRFGLERRAWQASLVWDYEFENGITLSSISAYHSNEWMALDDLDRRATEVLPDEPNKTLRDTALLNGRDLEDFSQEIRFSSADDQRLRWAVGGSFVHSEGVRTSGFRVGGNVRSFSFGNVFDIQTYGIFGSAAYDITDRLTLNFEARHQWDNLTEARTTGEESLSDTFTNFTPRAILEFKPNDDITLYASYAKGTRPGAFNAALIGLPQSVLDQVKEQIGADLAVPEEKLDNYEVGFKGSFLNGRAQLTAALYLADWQAQTVGLATVTFPDRDDPEIIATNGTGGEIDLWGIEVEGIMAATDNLTLEGTFSFNDSEIQKASCSDCNFLLGFDDISGLGKQLSRNPKYQGSAGLMYKDALTAAFDWYTRVDYIFTGSRWATDANLTKTGDSHRVNLRAGVETDTFRLELFGENIFDDKTFTNYQVLLDFAYFDRRVITAGLPDRAVWGARASYKF